MFFAYKKILGRTETPTRERMYCQSIRTVRDISRDDWARIATCSLRTPTDRQTDRLKENYSIDCSVWMYTRNYLLPLILCDLENVFGYVCLNVHWQIICLPIDRSSSSACCPTFMWGRLPNHAFPQSSGHVPKCPTFPSLSQVLDAAHYLSASAFLSYSCPAHTSPSLFYPFN